MKRNIKKGNWKNKNPTSNCRLATTVMDKLYRKEDKPMKKFIGFFSMLSIILGACAADSPDVIGTSFEMTIAVMAGCFILATMLGLIAYILPEKKKHRNDGNR